MKKAFLVDYTTDDKGNFKIYEVQDVKSSDYHKTFKDKGQKAYASLKFMKSFLEKYGDDIHELPAHLATNSDSKAPQRAMFQQFSETAQYNPDLLIINRNSREPLTEEETVKIKAFLVKHDNKAVIKGSGTLGQANFFTKDMSEEDIIAKVNEFIQKGASIVLEEQVMLTNEQVTQKHQVIKPDIKETGVFRRDIVVYDTEDSSVEHFEVYSQVLDTSVTTDNHKYETGVYNYETGYLETNGTIDKLSEYMDERKALYPDEYAHKAKFFRDIVSAIEGELEIDESSLTSDQFLGEAHQAKTQADISQNHPGKRIPNNEVLKGSIYNLLKEYGVSLNINKFDQLVEKLDDFIDRCDKAQPLNTKQLQKICNDLTKPEPSRPRFLLFESSSKRKQANEQIHISAPT
ncbi:hypothetical protein L3V83_06275 [Thiotrichales bacterium 19X7-9]|nr:hypothetical protein [Thiotrichales bacterium 19X7-9]